MVPDFEHHYGKKGGMVGRGSAAGSDGAERAIVAYQGPEMAGPLVYTPSRGLVTFQISSREELELVDTELLHEFLDLAGQDVSNLEWVEAEAKFIIRKGGNAFRMMAPSLEAVPSWVRDVFGHQMQPWGYRYVTTDVREWSQPVNKLVPYFEFTFEPYTKDPSKVFSRILLREQEYASVKAHLDSLEEKLSAIEHGVGA